MKKLLDGTLKLSKIKMEVFLIWVSKKVSNSKNQLAVLKNQIGVQKNSLNWHGSNEIVISKLAVGSCKLDNNFVQNVPTVCNIKLQLLLFQAYLCIFQSQIILRSNILQHHFYLAKVIILQVQTGLEYSAR